MNVYRILYDWQIYSQGIGIGYCLSWINVSMAFESVRMVDKVKHASRTLGGASSSSPGIHLVGRLFIRQSHTLATTSSTSTLVNIVLYVDIFFFLQQSITTKLTNIFLIPHCIVSSRRWDMYKHCLSCDTYLNLSKY